MAKGKKKELKIENNFDSSSEDTLEELNEKIEREYKINELDSIYSLRHRARSIMVGTAFGGVVEVSMRTENNYMYAQIQPTEVVELIEQLAAGIGVEIAMRPKVNFASWRGWEEVIDQRIGWDRIAWKGTAAWQLGGKKLEEEHQKKIGPSSETSTEVERVLPYPIEDEEENEVKKVTKKSRRTKKVDKE